MVCLQMPFVALIVQDAFNKIQQQVQTYRHSVTQINHIMLHSGVQVHMPTKLIQALAGFCCRVGMESPLRAFLNHFQAPRCTQPENATLLAAIPRCHDNGHSFVQHCLHQSHRGSFQHTEKTDMPKMVSSAGYPIQFPKQYTASAVSMVAKIAKHGSTTESYSCIS